MHTEWQEPKVGALRDDGEGVGSKKWLALAAACLTLLTISISTTATIAAMVVMSRDLGIPPSVLPWIMNAYTLTAAALLLFGGRISQRLGVVCVYRLGSVLMLGSSVLIALAPNAAMVLTGRAIQGLCLALLAPNNVVICKSAFPRREHLLAIGIIGGTGGLGFALGPMVGGFLTHCLSWRWVFWFNIPLILSAMVLLQISGLKSSASSKGLDIGGALTLAGGMALLLIGLSEVNKLGWSSARAIVQMTVGVVLLMAFLLWEPRARSPLLNPGVFRSRVFDAANLAYGLTFVCVAGFLYFFSLFAQNPVRLGFSAAQTGAALLPFGAPFFVMSFLTKRVADRWGPRLPCAVGFAVAATGFFLLGRPALEVAYRDMLIPMLLLGVGLGFPVAVLPGLAVGSVRDEDAGMAGGMIYTQVYLFASLITVLGTLAYLSAGRQTLYADVAESPLSWMVRAQLDLLLGGHLDAPQQALEAITPGMNDLSIHILRDAVGSGFATVMRLLSVVALLGGAVILALLPRRSAH